MTSYVIHVVIQDLARTVFEGDVSAISSINEKGPFDILSFHENFISLIKDQITLTHLEGAKQQIKLNAGVLRNMDNVVQIFIGVDTL
jgi:F0F1-type ATP synthase epsilon subunit